MNKMLLLVLFNLAFIAGCAFTEPYTVRDPQTGKPKTTSIYDRTIEGAKEGAKAGTESGNPWIAGGFILGGAAAGLLYGLRERSKRKSLEKDINTSAIVRRSRSGEESL